MSFSIGIDIGGTKIAGALYDKAHKEVARFAVPTPDTYDALLSACCDLVARLEEKGRASSIGVCAPFADETMCANMPFLIGKNLQMDLETQFNRPIPYENDAVCAALAEALEGAGRGYESVVGLILGTGVGSGFVLGGHPVRGANGLCGEIGHLPLPAYEDSDGVLVSCGCGRRGCIETFISGAGLSRLYANTAGKQADARQISKLAQQRDKQALEVLDRYYTLVAKAMVCVLHSFDPRIIVVSGGLSALSGLYDEVPKRWSKYAARRKLKTAFKPALLGPVAGLRGAALLGEKYKKSYL